MCAYGFKAEFRNPIRSAIAAKIRVIQTCLPQVQDMHAELVEVQKNYLNRPLGQWHYASFVQILHQASRYVHGDLGINTKTIWQNNPDSFQACMTKAIHAAVMPYLVERRIRQKLGRWCLTTPIGHATRRVLWSLGIIQRRCPPRVCSGYLRTLFNGWTTSRRMRTLAGGAERIQSCVFGCSGALDCIEHYALCPILWRFLSKPKPMGLGLPMAHRSLDNFLLAARGTTTQQVVAMATAVYASHRASMALRKDRSLCPERLLRLAAAELLFVT